MSRVRNSEEATLTFSAGQAVTWLHVPRGGYGYVYPVDGVVTKVGPARITIRVQKKDGTQKRVSVKPERLVPRKSDAERISCSQGIPARQ